MTQQSGNQFDDDLTVGMDDGSYSTDSIDLFEFTGDDESPIARLKTIILSIDWEINDDILQQLDEELVDLGDIWAGDKIKQVYVQGLSKIGKYIFKEKANAHPNAIKLLITFYHNLERIVSSDDLMSEEEKKQLLMKDVKLFDQLKEQIGLSDTGTGTVSVASVPSEEKKVIEKTDELKALKAHVLGLDWEINDQELQKLDDEVHRLEGVFSQNKAKLILLQGIGAISSYINKMRSQSNSSAFTLLHSFYGTLETITESELPAGEQKQLLLSEVEKFNAFKADISATQSEPVEVASKAVPSSSIGVPATAVVTDADPAPALTDTDSEEDEKVASDVESRLDAVFGDEEDEKSPSLADENAALEGVNVESEADDDSDEEALPFYGDTVAPALSEVEEESSFSVEKLAGDLAQSLEEDDQEEDVIESESILQGVDVETEADDDSDEDALPFEDGELAPALTGSSDDSGFDEGILADELEQSDSEDLENRLDSFFDDEVQSSSDEWSADKEGVLQEIEAELGDDSPAPALSDSEEHSVEENVSEEVIEEQLSFFDEEVPVPTLDMPPDQIEEEEPAGEDSTLEQLSFLDEDIEAPGSSDTDEVLLDDERDEEIEDDEQSFFDGDSPAPALTDETELAQVEDETEQVTAEEETVEESTEEALSIFDEVAPEPDNEEPDQETNVLPADAEELSDTEEITFTVPGEVAAATVAAAAVATSVGTEETEAEDVIEFMVPGEEEPSEPPIASTEDLEEEEVVFEAVDDGVEVDPLPGEEYADSTTAEFSSMGSAIVSLQEKITVDGLQNLFTEINKSRNLDPTNHIGKVFLQLLSTTCQHVERNMENPDADSLSLMDEVFLGFEMSSSPEASDEQVQKYLLTCTSKVLLLQQKEILNK